MTASVPQLNRVVQGIQPSVPLSAGKPFDFLLPCIATTRGCVLSLRHPRLGGAAAKGRGDREARQVDQLSIYPRQPGTSAASFAKIAAIVASIGQRPDSIVFFCGVR